MTRQPQQRPDKSGQGATLQQLARRWRSQPVPDQVQDKVWRALAQARDTPPVEPQAPVPTRVEHWQSWRGLGFASGLAAAVLAVVLYESVRQEQLIIERERWVDLALESNEFEPVEIELRTHHHADEDHHVRVEAPAAVQVAMNPPRPGPAPDCSAQTCVHTFDRSDVRPSRLVLSVSQPGKYPIAVQHASPQRTVHEHIVLHAHP